MVLGTIPMHAQNKIRLEGTVLDGTTGEAVIGASILVKGTSNGAITDIDGHFSILVPEGSSLVVNSIGYDEYELQAIKAESNITITLNPSSEFLEEVVVVAYGSVK